MTKPDNPTFLALNAARDYGISTIMFRNALARQFGLNLTESLCLTYLGVEGSASPSRLAHFAGLTSGATTTLLDRLEKRGFIRREPNPQDRRGVRVVADSSWNTRASKLVEGIGKANLQLVQDYSPEQLELIAHFMSRLAANTNAEAKALHPEAGLA